jgi:hypothetical protein
MGWAGKKKDDEVAYILEYNEDQTNVRLTLISGRQISGEDFLQALNAYVEDFIERPESLFLDGIEMADERH